MPVGLFKSFVDAVDSAFTGRGVLDDALADDLEEMLVRADVNVHTASAVIEELRLAVRDHRAASGREAIELVKSLLVARFADGSAASALRMSSSPPTLYVVVGVNGVGKTTTIGKLAARLRRQGRSVLLAAGDTFRAAAIDQLELWADRVGAGLVKHREGTDPSAVVFDAISAARARSIDVVIADTAGRLHTRTNLLEELKKVMRIAERELGRPPDEVLLVLDATTGQNAVNQARQFTAAVGVTGVVLAKLDGTARAGIAVTLADEFHVPIKLTGLGESADDLAPFDARAFVDGLFA